VIGSNTDLSGVGEFPPHDAGGVQFEFGIGDGSVYDTGVFSAEFEGVGGEMFCCCRCDKVCSVRAACIDYMIEFLS
jgi:hypothetical protein